jgi:hypothetical protein
MSVEHPIDRSVDSPADAHRAMLALLHSTVVEAARRRQEELPGLVETLQDDVVLTTGGTSRTAYGWFAERAWRYDGRRVHELFVNADRRVPHPLVSAAEDVLTTLCTRHATCGRSLTRCRTPRGTAVITIGTSGGSRWPSASWLEKDPMIGHRTPGLAPWAQADYADLLGELDYGMVLAREPKLPEPVGGDPEPDDGADEDVSATGSAGSPAASSAKYVFASCCCHVGRRSAVTIRVAKGSWRPGVIRCAACQEPFIESL